MSKLLCNVLKISGGANAPNPPLLVARLVRALLLKKYYIKLLKKVWYIILVLCTWFISFSIQLEANQGN